MTEQEAFELLLAREFGDPEYFAVHHLTVAAYRLEHPAGATDHTLAVLLSVVRAAIDGGLDGPQLRRHSAWASRRLREHPPGPVPRPEGRAATRVTDVAAARDAAEHCASVRRWAAEVWEAWRPVADVVLPGSPAA
jgi:hypothetical protein